MDCITHLYLYLYFCFYFPYERCTHFQCRYFLYEFQYIYYFNFNHIASNLLSYGNVSAVVKTLLTCGIGLTRMGGIRDHLVGDHGPTLVYTYFPSFYYSGFVYYNVSFLGFHVRGGK